MQKQKNTKPMNDSIQASQVSLITETGEQLGLVPLQEAIERAESVWMDVVQVSERDGEVVAKIMDWGKIQFQKQKNIAKSRSSSKKTALKTIRITYKIGDHDLEIRRKQAEKFAKTGHPIKVTLMLRGRERRFGDIAKEKVQAFVESLEHIYTADGPVTQSGNVFSASMKLKK